MRTIRRTVILLGCIGFITLFALQYIVALAATPLIAVVGILTGLVIAKWLPWGWYGRQFAAGVRGGVVASGFAAAGVLLSLVGSGAPSVATLAARSHLPGINLAQIVSSFGALGWLAPYLFLTAFFTVSGILLAGVVAQIFGWSKSVRTVRVIREAHNSASLLHRHQTWAPASNSVPSIGGYWNSILPSAGPASPVSHPGQLATGTMGVSGHTSGGHLPVSAGAVARARGLPDTSYEQKPAYLTPLPPLYLDEPESMTPLPLPLTPDPIPPRRSYSGAQPVQFAMTDDLRNALDRWDVDPEHLEPEQSNPDTDEESAVLKKNGDTKNPAASRAKTPSKRTPKASAYLNSDPPAAPRRSRKKQDTRDWLC
jgi:hypothetical protein